VSPASSSPLESAVSRTRSEILLAALVPFGLVMLSSLGAVGAFVSSLPAMHVSLWASETPSAFVALVATGVVLASLPRTTARIGAALALVAALGLAFIGSSAFRERFGRDLFASPGTSIPVSEASLTRIREVTVPGGATRLLLSPRGGSFAVALEAGDNARESDYVVETAPGRLSSMRAVALEFIDEERILVLERNEDRAMLKARAFDRESSVVLHDLPLLAGVDLDADPSGIWQVTGYDRVEGALLIVRGSFDGGAPRETRFSSEEDGSTLVAVSPGLRALVARYDMPGLPLLALGATPRLVMPFRSTRRARPRRAWASPFSRLNASRALLWRRASTAPRPMAVELVFSCSFPSPLHSRLSASFPGRSMETTSRPAADSS